MKDLKASLRREDKNKRCLFDTSYFYVKVRSFP